jgi:hypothetical protein
MFGRGQLHIANSLCYSPLSLYASCQRTDYSSISHKAAFSIDIAIFGYSWLCMPLGHGNGMIMALRKCLACWQHDDPSLGILKRVTKLSPIQSITRIS